MKKLLFSSMAIFLHGIFIANAQSDSTDDKFNFKIGVYYNSHLNYYGRTDSVQSSGIFPMAELWFNKKFYINAAPVFTTNQIAGFQYAGAVATAGYFKNNGRSIKHIYFIKPLYKDNSQLVQSSLKAQLAASFTQLNKVINITAGADIKMSGDIDYGASFGLDHIFKKKLKRNTVLVIDPSINLYAGTQRFTQMKNKNSGFLFFPGEEQSITEEVKKFSILSYEFSLPVILGRGNWMVLATPSFVLPQSLVVVEGHPELSEKGKEMLYITIGAKISL